MIKGRPHQLAARRIAIGMTQADLAADIGVSQQSISMYENGREIPGTVAVRYRKSLRLSRKEWSEITQRA